MCPNHSLDLHVHILPGDVMEHHWIWFSLPLPVVVLKKNKKSVSEREWVWWSWETIVRIFWGPCSSEHEEAFRRHTRVSGENSPRKTFPYAMFTQKTSHSYQYSLSLGPKLFSKAKDSH
jgi:hypothetical protein